jgi:hypothetical protein
LKVDLKAFPNGLKPLSDLARSKGMKWTMYSDAGVRMCDPEVPSPVLGSLGHEKADAEFFKTLNTEYVKCKSQVLAFPRISMLTRLKMTTAMLMALCLLRTPRKMLDLISSHEWARCGQNSNAWASQAC